MLVEKKSTFVPGDIIVIKTVGNEEITGKVTSIDDTSVTVTRPVALIFHPTGGSQGQVVFAPFLLGLEDHAKVTFPFDKLIILPIKARSDLASQYTKATTGLEVPTSKLVV